MNIGGRLDDCVFARIVGGIGNQMFQYAAGRALARHLGCPLKLDLSAFRSYKLRAYELDSFRLTESVASAEELAVLKRRARIAKLLCGRWLGGTFPALLGPVFKEPHLHFTPELFDMAPPVLLRGYWQSPRYFADLRDELSGVFQPKGPLSPYSQEMLARIAAAPAVSVHVRRGDYLTNPSAAKTIGVLDIAYYRRSIELMTRLVPEAHFFIFSDDIPYVRQALDFCPNWTLVDGNHGDGFQDMMVMRACDHHIIANSSFSWWSAWLGTNERKTVIAPRKWFTEEGLRTISTRDRYPEEWITMG